MKMGEYHLHYSDLIEEIIMKYPPEQRWCLSYTYIMHRKAFSSPSGTVIWRSIWQRIVDQLEELEVEVGEELTNEQQHFKNVLLFCLYTINAVRHRDMAWLRQNEGLVEQCYRQCCKDLEQINGLKD